MIPSETREATVERQRFLKISEVVDLVGVSRATIYRMIDSGAFPRPVRVSAMRVVWVKAEIDAWMRDMAEAPRR